jgi:hypothetical protein
MHREGKEPSSNSDCLSDALIGPGTLIYESAERRCFKPAVHGRKLKRGRMVVGSNPLALGRAIKEFKQKL